MNIIISNTSNLPIYQQIVTQIKVEIMAKHIAEGELLPSIRALARELRISVITTKKAYEELEKEGFIVSAAGKGSYVAPQNTEMMRESKLKQVEEHLTKAVNTAKMFGISREEVEQVLYLLYEEEE